MPHNRSIASDFANVGRGLLMGAADIIPGVSGGTVALLLGIYPRLLSAISHVDGALFNLVRRRKWRDAAEHLDLKFLAALLAGILSGILTLAGLMHYLLTDHREATMAAFFGLILASSVLVVRMIQPTSPKQATACWGLGIVGALAAAALVLSSQLEQHDGLLYVFLCGAIAICAMILPGISGAYILVLLGEYEYIIGILHRLKAGDVGWHDLLTVGVFVLGCALGLIAFSKFLKALLARYQYPTMSVLAGFMVGSLVKVWPFQQMVDSTNEKVTRPYWPNEISSQVVLCGVISIVAFAAVMIIEWLARHASNRVAAKEHV